MADTRGRKKGFVDKASCTVVMEREMYMQLKQLAGVRKCSVSSIMVNLAEKYINDNGEILNAVNSILGAE